LHELRALLDNFPIEVLGLADLQIREESPETGHSFLQNAMQKALFYFQRAAIPVLADDSGLEVDALNGAPGIHSARFGGLKRDAAKCDYLLTLLEDVPDLYRTARFHCAAVFYDGLRYISANATLEGYIGSKPIGSNGFGYDPLFRSELHGPTLAEITTREKNLLSHRGKAFRELIKAVLKLSDIHL
jgi:XTP/dITP diphosphohydrolase